MPACLGPQTFPLPPIGSKIKILQDPLSSIDPGLLYLGSFLTSFLNARFGQLWGQTLDASRRNEKLVNNFKFAWNPREYGIDESLTPSLFLWRERSGSQDRRLSSGIIISSTVQILWLGPTEMHTNDQGRLRSALRSRIGQSISAVCGQASQSWRDRSWLLDGDTDPLAPIMGSNAFPKMGLWKMPQILGWEHYQFNLQQTEDNVVFPGVLVRLLCEEFASGNLDGSRLEGAMPPIPPTVGAIAFSGDYYLARESSTDTDVLIGESEIRIP